MSEYIIKMFQDLRASDRYMASFIRTNGEVEFVVEADLLYDFLLQVNDYELKEVIQRELPMNDVNPNRLTGIQAIDNGITGVMLKKP